MLCRRTGASNGNAEQQQHSQCPLKLDNQDNVHEVLPIFPRGGVHAPQEGIEEPRVSGRGQAKNPRSRRKQRAIQQHRLCRTPQFIDASVGHTSLCFKHSDASPCFPKRPADWLLSATHNGSPPGEKGGGASLLDSIIGNFDGTEVLRRGSGPSGRGLDSRSTNQVALVHQGKETHAVTSQEKGSHLHYDHDASPATSRSTKRNVPSTLLGEAGVNDSSGSEEGALEKRLSEELTEVHPSVERPDSLCVPADLVGLRRCFQKKCRPVIEAHRPVRSLRNRVQLDAEQAPSHSHEDRLDCKEVKIKQFFGSQQQLHTDSSQANSSAQPSARGSRPSSRFSSSDSLSLQRGPSSKCPTKLKVPPSESDLQIRSSRSRSLLQDAMYGRRSSVHSQPLSRVAPVSDRISQFACLGVNTREAALRELERRRRIPAVTSASPLPFPYLNRARDSSCFSLDSPHDCLLMKSAKSQSLEQREKPRVRGQDGIFQWLWRRVRNAWISGSGFGEEGPCQARAGDGRRRKEASSNRSLLADTSHSCLSIKEGRSNSEGSGLPDCSPQPSSLPLHLQLQMQLLLSREDRLYYGETFASYVRHGCGFALYGGWVGTEGDGGAWATRAIQRLGLVSRRSPWALLPAAEPAVPLRPPGRGRGTCVESTAAGTRSLGGYCGFWRLDKREGWGVMLRGPSALKYEGQWLGDSPHGLGVLTLSQGGRYVGSFRNGFKHGTGVLVQPGGIMYAGEWRAGRVVRQQLLFAKRPSEVRRFKWKPNFSCSSSSSSSSTSVSESRERRGLSGAGAFELQKMQQRRKHRPLATSSRTPTRQFVASRCVACTSRSSGASEGSQSEDDGGNSDQESEKTRQKKKPGSLKTEPRQLSTASAVPAWRVVHVQLLLESVGFAKEIRDLLYRQQVDGPALLALREGDLVQMGLAKWEQRRLLLLLQDILLKLLHRHRMRAMCNSQWLQEEQFIQQIVIPASEIQIEAPIGEGGYSKVFRAKWRYTQSMELQTERASYGGSDRDPCRKIFDVMGSKVGGAPEGERNHWSRKQDLPAEIPSRSDTASAGHIREQLEESSLKGGYSSEMRVAVKVFRQRDVQQLQRSLRSELHVLQLLRHPNVVLLLGVVGAPLFGLVTEYVTGGSLFDLLHKRRMHLPLMEVVRLAREVALGMEYLHARGVMHCDLKSPNILISKSGDVKLCDFGLATLVEAGGGSQSPWWLQQPHSQNVQEAAAHLGCVGTHHWMAPEGLSSAAHLITAVGYGGLTPPLENIPPPLTGLLHLCLQTQPDKRPTFAACAEALHNMYTTSLMDVEGDLNALLGLGE